MGKGYIVWQGYVKGRPHFLTPGNFLVFNHSVLLSTWLTCLSYSITSLLWEDTLLLSHCKARQRKQRQSKRSFRLILAILEWFPGDYMSMCFWHDLPGEVHHMAKPSFSGNLSPFIAWVSLLLCTTNSKVWKKNWKWSQGYTCGALQRGPWKRRTHAEKQSWAWGRKGIWDIENSLRKALKPFWVSPHDDG